MFLYGFAKKERDNIEEDELETLREIGAVWLEAKIDRLEHAIREGILHEAGYDDGKQETWQAGPGQSHVIALEILAEV